MCEFKDFWYEQFWLSAFLSSIWRSEKSPKNVTFEILRWNDKVFSIFEFSYQNWSESLMLKVNYNFARKFKIEMFSCKITVFENHRKVLTLRAKRATFTFWVDKSSLKVPKTVNFGEFLISLKLAVKQCYQIDHF